MRLSPSTAGSWSALLGAAWSLYLLPPQLLEWNGTQTPGWIEDLATSPLYGWTLPLDGLGGLDAYAWSGVLLIPSWLLIGLPLVRQRRRGGRGVAVVGAITVLGAAVCTASYLAADATGTVHLLWGTEALVLLLLGAAALLAGPLAVVRHGAPRWWGGLLAATLLVLAAGTLALGYYPHGSLVGLGIEVAVLCGAGRSRVRT